MRKILLLLLTGTGLAAQAQLKIDNATFFIGAGATVTVQGDVTSNVDIQGTGLLQLKGSSLQNIDMGGHSIPNLEIDNTSNVALLGSNTRIGTSLLFTNGRLQTGNQHLVISSTAGITGYNSSRFVQTNGTGVLTREGLGTASFVYPVGYGPGEYNPLTVANNGTVDDISVRCLQNVLANGLTGAVITSDFANNSWVVSEAVAGGSSLTMTGEWTAGDELPGFDRTKSGIARYNTGTDWDLPANIVGTASGSGPYSNLRNAVNTIGVFAVADMEKVNRANMALKIFLQGAFSGTAGTGGGLMRDNYRSSGVLPATQPYGTGKFAHTGLQGGSESFNPAILAVTGNDAIVDWVFVTLHDASNPSTKYQTRAALLQRDGDVVDMDGVSPLSMPINADGNYIVSVGHRNHLSVRVPNTSPLNLVENGSTASWDFTTGMAQAYTDGSITTNGPMIAVTTSGVTKFCLIGGNTDGVATAGINGRKVIYSGSGNDRGPVLSAGLGGNASITNVITAGNFATMARYDLTMNGVIIYSGSGNDPLIISAALGGNTSATATEHQ
ncbi:MAG: hypothetical protein U0U70_06350 [Chitinophagaceae bacterium]